MFHCLKLAEILQMVKVVNNPKRTVKKKLFHTAFYLLLVAVKTYNPETNSTVFAMNKAEFDPSEK